ncbi:hypothetical protein J4405_01345 [Candidatus Woesearchaeota archaeon]|nr:hypothetical protein [Candidatus Woesearchaeota archaeon]
MSEIYLGFGEKLTIEQGKEGRTFSLYLPGKPEVSTKEIKPNPHVWLKKIEELRRTGSVEISGNETPVVTHSAGSISVFYENGERKYVSFSQKDESAPRDPGFRVPRNGFPSNSGEWFTNRHLYRESWEEGIFLTEDGRLVLPKSPIYDYIIKNVAKRIVEQTGLKIRGSKRTKINFENGKDTLEIFYGPEKKCMLFDYGAISWTPETGFNFIKEMAVYAPISDLRLIDGETFPDGKVIGRDICIIDLEQLQGKTFGDEIEEEVHSFRDGKFVRTKRNSRFLTDRVPRSFLSSLIYKGKPVYPADAIDEAYAFVSDEQVLRTFDEHEAKGEDPNKFKWSTLERKLRLGE